MSAGNRESLRSILISYEEYQRLKTVESRFEELQKQIENKEFSSKKEINKNELHGRGENQTDDDSSSDSEHMDQYGSGLKKSQFIEKIASLVSQKLQPPIATTEWQNYNLNPPNVSILASTNSTPALKFENVISNNKNDKFDQKRLLKFVPSNFKEKARQLLEKIEQNPEQLNFSSDGIIYINKTSIPNSDVFHLFPYLFKARRPKSLDGFEDFLNQIHEMGLTHLIKSPISKSTITKTQEAVMSSGPNWWYLGP